MTKIQEIMKETERFVRRPSETHRPSQYGGRSITKMLEEVKRAEMKNGVRHLYRNKISNNRDGDTVS